MLQGRSRFFLVAAIFATFKLAGQMTTGTILGRVADQSGAVVPNTKITLVNTGTNDARTVTVNDTGDFTFPQLPPAQYNLTAEHEGFRKDVHNGIILEVGQQARVDVSLQVGAVSEQVEVTASAPLVSTETAALGNVVDN